MKLELSLRALLENMQLAPAKNVMYKNAAKNKLLKLK